MYDLCQWHHTFCQQQALPLLRSLNEGSLVVPVNISIQGCWGNFCHFTCLIGFSSSFTSWICSCIHAQIVLRQLHHSDEPAAFCSGHQESGIAFTHSQITLPRSFRLMYGFRKAICSPAGHYFHRRAVISAHVSYLRWWWEPFGKGTSDQLKNTSRAMVDLVRCNCCHCSPWGIMFLRH